MKKYIIIILAYLTGSIGLQAMERNTKEMDFGRSVQGLLVQNQPQENPFNVRRGSFRNWASSLALINVLRQAVDRAKRDKIKTIVARNIFAETFIGHITDLYQTSMFGGSSDAYARTRALETYNEWFKDLVDQYFSV